MDTQWYPFRQYDRLTPIGLGGVRVHGRINGASKKRKRLHSLQSVTRKVNIDLS